jgi:hypothetical protein
MFERTKVVLGDIAKSLRVVGTALVILGAPLLVEIFVVYPAVGLGSAAGVVMGVSYALMLVISFIAVAYGITYLNGVESRANDMRRRKMRGI